MHSTKRRARIRFATTLLAVLISAYAVYWTWGIGRHMLRRLDTDAFLNFYLVENHAPVTLLQKLAYFGLHVPILVCGLATFYVALRLIWMLRKGDFFLPKTGRAFQLLGVALAVCIAFDSLYLAFFRSVLTWNNTGVVQKLEDGSLSRGFEYIAPAFQFSNSHATIMLCALAFVVFGWIMHEAAMIEQENKGFV